MDGPVDAIRLTIRYGGDRFEIVKRTRVRKVVPPSAPLLDDDDVEFGAWAEVRAGGRSVYRQLLADQLGRDIEVFTSDPDRPISRVAVDDPVGVFTVIVPMLDDADEIAIVGPPRDAPERRRRKASEPATVQDLATFSLRDEPDGAAS
jgi:hypothetical protein